MQLAKQARFAKFQPFLKTSVFSSLGATVRFALIREKICIFSISFVIYHFWGNTKPKSVSSLVTGELVLSWHLLVQIQQ